MLDVVLCVSQFLSQNFRWSQITKSQNFVIVRSQNAITNHKMRSQITKSSITKSFSEKIAELRESPKIKKGFTDRNFSGLLQFMRHQSSRERQPMLLCSNDHATDRGYYYILKVSRDIQQFATPKQETAHVIMLKRSRYRSRILLYPQSVTRHSTVPRHQSKRQPMLLHWNGHVTLHLTVRFTCYV
jgi:hypothetical protein